MAYQSLSSLVPDADDLLKLDPEELAGVLLVHLNQQDAINRHNFFNSLRHTPPLVKPEYGEKQSEIIRALMEAWAWLEKEGFLVNDPTATGDLFFLSRRARRLTTREEFDAYRKASLLPRGQLHPLIASTVYPAFLRGNYDTAIFEAFREVEVAVRDAGKFGPNDYGTDLMRAAFKPAAKNNPVPPGTLTDTQLPIAEQEAMANLFAGAIGLYKNPQSHRHVPTHAEDAAEVIVFASQLLRIVDRLRP